MGIDLTANLPTKFVPVPDLPIGLMECTRDMCIAADGPTRRRYHCWRTSGVEDREAKAAPNVQGSIRNDGMVPHNKCPRQHRIGMQFINGGGRPPFHTPMICIFRSENMARAQFK